MERLFTKLCMLIVVALALQMHGNKGCLEKERIALLAIKPFIINAIVLDEDVDDHNRTIESWVDDRVSNCCDWYRVECSTTTGRVMNLSLPGLLCESTTILNFSLFQPFEQLQILDLSHNWFDGWIDSRAHHLKQLNILNLGRNNFNNSILSYLTAITSLTTLILNQNDLEDFNPTQGAGLANLTNLEFLDLSDNRMNGSLQELGLANLTNLEHLDLSRNYIQELGLANLTNLEFLDLSGNQMNGSLQQANLRNLKFLDLSENGMNGSLQELGSIPESFSNLTNIESLDLSHNKLNGRIPPQLTQLNDLGTFNVSFNNLSGPVPDKGQFGTFVESSYGGNPGLCGPQIKRSCGSSEPTTPPVTPSQEVESAIDMVSFYWSLFTAYVTTIMAFVLILWLNSDWRKQWFCFIDACIISSYCWILRNVFHRYGDIYVDKTVEMYSITLYNVATGVALQASVA